MAGLVLLVFGMLALTIRGAIVAVTPDTLVSAATPENQDELIQIGRHTLLLKHGSATNRIAHWMHRGSANSKAFEVGKSSFVANSDALTLKGEERVGAFAQMMTHVRDLNAQIFVSTYRSNPQLAELRARHLRADLIADGVTPARVSVSDEPIAGGMALSTQPEIVLVLSS
ncbi:MAG TPA: hypothetical protein VK192_00420 [Sphingomicrobium sp.]|nr:hypothetical protein [Sphingomicrobium sp.]